MDQEGNKKVNQYIFIKNLGRLKLFYFIIIKKVGHLVE